MKTLGTILLFFMPFAVLAEDGYVYGKGHCYYFNAPRGWALDASAGRNQGIPMVFYPMDSSWAEAATVIYTHNNDFAPGARTPKERIQGQVDRVLKDFRTSGAGPSVKAAFVRPIQSRHGARGELWRFSGDKWGNSEMVAYFLGRHTINFFVMTSRDAKDFERALPALLEIAASYREANDCKPCNANDITTTCSGR